MSLDAVTRIVVLSIVLTVTVLPAVGLLLLRDARKARKDRRERTLGRFPDPAPEPSGVSAPWYVSVSLIMGFAVCSWLGLFASTRIWIAIAVILLFLWLRNRDPVVCRALKRLRRGERVGVAAELLPEFERKPTAPRANILAVALMAQSRWSEAYKYLLEAKERGLDPTVYRTNLALALTNLDRPGDAIAVLEPAVLGRRVTTGEVINYCQALIALDRLDEARHQLGRLERMYRKVAWISTGHLRTSIDECRSRLEARTGEKKPVGFDEL